MPFQVLKLYRRSRLVRLAAALVVLIGAAILQYYLANVRLPVDIGATNKFSPATIKLGQEELVIKNPFVNPSEGLLLSHVGNPNEVVDVYFDRARLGEESISLFEALGSKPPPASGPIDYITQNPARASDAGEACRTFVQIEVPDASNPIDEFHLYQLEDPGLNRYRLIELKTIGRELIVHVSTEAPPGGSPESPGCRKFLRAGDWNQPLTGSLGLKIFAAAGSSFHLVFRPVVARAPLWKGPDGFFEPFGLGSPKLNPGDLPPFQAKAVSIKPLQGDSSTGLSREILSAQATDKGALLSVDSLKIGSNQLQLGVSGNGRVKINGEDVTVDLFDRAKRYPIPAGLLAAANAALLAWFMSLFSGKRQSPALESDSSHPLKSRRRFRKRKKV
jgi:hypothetical protein